VIHIALWSEKGYVEYIQVMKRNLSMMTENNLGVYRITFCCKPNLDVQIIIGDSSGPVNTTEVLGAVLTPGGFVLIERRAERA
jgi:hypothetical protein